MASLRGLTTLGSRIDGLRAEIGFNDAGMIPDIGRAAVRQLFPVVENGDAVAGSHHDLYVMLDKHHGDASRLNSTDQADQPAGFRSIQAGCWFVRQNKL